MTHSQAAEAVGRSRTSVTNMLRLLELPQGVREQLEARQLNMGHARALLGLASPELMLELAARVVRQGWSVRETERAVRKLAAAEVKGGRANGAKKGKDANIRSLETRLAETLGAPVRIEHGAKGGRLVIPYTSIDELEGILDHIK